MKKLNLGLVAIALAMMVVPASSANAALYAYVDQNGEVKTVTANDPMTAMMTAPNIDEHSGVMLLTNPSDSIIGDDVQSV